MSNILFNAVGAGMVTYYRTLLPALMLGHDVLIQNGDATVHQLLTSDGEQDEDKVYDSVIMQMPMQPWHPNQIKALQETGSKVIVNVDDYIHDLPDMKGKHELYSVFSQDHIDAYESSMSLADGIITSTDWLADRWKDSNRTWVCPNGLDLGRYNCKPVSRPKGFEDLIVLGWSGAVGHLGSFGDIAHVLSDLMREYDQLGLFTVGARVFKKLHYRKQFRKRLKHFDWMDHWDYPPHMMMFDIGLAPAEDSDFFRAKSQLRLYEYSAVGIPTIGHPVTYSEIDHGQTGFHAYDDADWYKYLRQLIRDEDLRLAMGASAHEKCWTDWGIGARETAWKKAINEF